MFGNHHHQRQSHFGFFGPHRRWADGEPPPEWPFGQFGRRWGGFGNFNQGPGGSGFGERFFGRGDLKYVILDLLKDQPRHGYDIIRALEERMGGRYRPSPGSVYPTLQMLEDLGYVTSDQQEGKKVYSITDAGRSYIREQSSTMDDIRSRITAGWDAAQRPETADLMHEVRELARALFRQGTRGALQDPERMKKLREIVAQARAQVDALDQERQPSPAGSSPSEPRMV